MAASLKTKKDAKFVTQYKSKGDRITTTFITYNTSYSEKFVYPNLARLIELGGV